MVDPRGVWFDGILEVPKLHNSTIDQDNDAHYAAPSSSVILSA